MIVLVTYVQKWKNKSGGANAHLHAICKLRKWRSSENGENMQFYKLKEKTKKEI